MKRSLTWRIWLVPGVYLLGMVIGMLGAYIEAPVAGAEPLFAPDPEIIPAGEIIKRNLTVLLIMLLGSFSVGAITLFVVFINGAMLGAFLQIFSVHGLLINVIIALLPHGIFEMSAYLLAGIADMFLVSCLIQLVRNHKTFNVTLLKKALLGNLIAAILIVIGGYVESAVFLWI